ncbi:MAG: secretin N-terminal domain-containing protein [Candidatus Omnitrophica bacterium]|nr:secretin N-terminal domain-containing protein [Candidatus Omnitrophota bacterium]
MSKKILALIISAVFSFNLAFAEAGPGLMPEDSGEQAQSTDTQPAEQIKETQPVAAKAAVRPVSTAVPQELPGKISLDIKGMDIVDVLKMLASRSNLNIVVGKNVTGRVTLFLKNIDTWDAFEIVVLSNDLAYEKKGNIINVMTQRDYEVSYGERFQDKKEAKTIKLKYAKANDLSKALGQMKTNIGKIVVDEGSNTISLIDSAQRIEEMEKFINETDLPLETKVFSLNYAQADKLNAKIQEIITKGVGSVRFDERTNRILVTDYPKKIEDISNIVSAFDEKSAQVLIDAQVIEVKPSDKLEMGIDWNYWIKKHFQASAALPINPTGALILSTATGTPSAPGDYSAILDLLRTVGDTKILSSPRIMVLNNQEAKILVGTKDAYITSAVTQTEGNAVTAETVNFVETGIKLFVTPLINEKGFVTMKIKPEVSSAETRTLISQDKKTEVPIVTTSEAETTVMVKDGVTIVIGGLRQDQHNKTVKKVPILGDLPGLRYFFSSTSDEITKTDLVILLTPHIISGEEAYTDFTEIKPENGAIVDMVNGEIVKDRIVYPKTNLSGEIRPDDYCNLVNGRINDIAKYTKPRSEKGEVEVAFTLSPQGTLAEEPRIIKSNNFKLNAYALKTIDQALPFPPFPKSLNEERKKFNITLIY